MSARDAGREPAEPVPPFRCQRAARRVPLSEIRRASVCASALAPRIAEAALETLKARGFAGAGAREITRTGGFNQALLLYHFGSVHNVLPAALELVSNRRVRAYEPAFKNARTVSELARLERGVGIDTLSHLDGDRTPAESRLDLGVRYALIVGALTSSPRTEKR